MLTRASCHLPVLLLRAAAVQYGAKILLNNARLKLKRGKRYGLCGPNGAGKSTLMRAIANGQVRLAGRGAATGVGLGQGPSQTATCTERKQGDQRGPGARRQALTASCEL